MLLHIGIDDTDSPRGGCTTYIAALLVEGLLKEGVRFVDYPNLIRLNPNVPWKTRGNGAVCLRIEVDGEGEGDVKRVVLDSVEAHADFECENTNPGVVFLEGDVTMQLREFSKMVIRGVVTIDEAERLIENSGASAIGYKNMRGIIGAVAAIGETLGDDHTYEFLAYRTPENRGKPRRLDRESISEMDAATRGETFNNLDPETRRPLIAPHGPDPVLFGIRGESAETVHRAGLMVRSHEAIERWVIFRTNHGTDSHLRPVPCISSLRPYNPAIVWGDVAARPFIIKGGHVIFSLKDESGLVDCAAYEPTGGFRNVVGQLIVGDSVRAHGGVRVEEGSRRKTLNLEKIEILKLRPDIRFLNPLCPECGGSMESIGRGQGHRCRKCGHRAPDLGKRAVENPRTVEIGLYIAPPRAQRHLTKPLERYGKEKRAHVLLEPVEPWHSP